MLPSTPDREGSREVSEISITLLWMEQGKASNRFKIFLASTVGMHRATADPSTLEACSPHSFQHLKLWTDSRTPTEHQPGPETGTRDHGLN